MLQEQGYAPPYTGLENGIGSRELYVMLKSSRQIGTDLETILERHGYQGTDASQDDYIGTGVNWGYTAARLAAGMDGETVFILVLLLGVILLTGYLVIYNVFRISVAGDVRFYGLLKTIGTTGRQLRRMIRLQALALSAAGIPLGLLPGWLAGRLLAPILLRNLEIGGIEKIVVHPLIFLAAAGFSLVTVLISCAVPGRLAAKVSPVEAVLYTEGSEYRKTNRNNRKVSPCHMAWASLGRSPSKTIITVLSLALAAVLFCMTVFFTDGFDMNKYLRDRAVCDFIVAPVSYFNHTGTGSGMDREMVSMIRERGGIRDGGEMYFRYSGIQEIVPAEHITSYFGHYYPELGQSILERGEQTGEGMCAVNAMVYGADPFLLSRLNVLEGNPDLLSAEDGHYIAAVCETDDYGNAIDGSVWAHAGDTVTLRYVEESEYYDPRTGHVFGKDEDFGSSWAARAVRYSDMEYEVAAVVTIPYTLSWRGIMGDGFVMGARSFKEYSPDAMAMYYAFDTREETNAAMEEFLAVWTNGAGREYNYESRASYEKEFSSFRGMFSLMGTALSFVAGLVGIINFVNAVFTGITSRRRELAVLQAVGMTNRQLREMLIWEGLFYAVGSALLALLLTSVLEPVLSGVLEKAFWFFSGRFTLLPAFLVLPVFVLLGAAVPLVLCRVLSKQTIVERLRETYG